MLRTLLELLLVWVLSLVLFSEFFGFRHGCDGSVGVHCVLNDRRVFRLSGLLRNSTIFSLREKIGTQTVLAESPRRGEKP